MREFLILIISASVAVITVYTVWFVLHLKRTLSGVKDFTAMLDTSLKPLMKELTALSARVNTLSSEISGWNRTMGGLKSSVKGIAGAVEALAAMLALRNIVASTQSKSKGMLTVLDFLRRR